MAALNEREERQPTRIQVRLLDLSKVTESKQAREIAESKGFDTIEPGFGPWGVFRLTDGREWLVCNEGVAYPVLPAGAPADEVASVPLYGRSEAREGDRLNTHTFGIVPIADLPIVKGQYDDLLSGKVVNLADHIRRFGVRLEGNYHRLVREFDKLAVDESADEELVGLGVA